MKVYKDGAKINADKDQWEALKKAGWTRSPDVVGKVPEASDIDESVEEVEVTPAKKPVVKRRKPIAKKSESKG